ncbi:hypothetical protein SERLA73DRAFT_129674 [Serpula lacrymans var. lacrymans S7.3]|uniref:Uncharacterized protein n=2 Tax=Serpula lacrymans var. lacrymans TaxID=341189 RepID=F8PIK6_SERL3|nr:uncharacterized protein SERLADRAFT_377594 [Serpula lacrymans var. lacrymans S7.9]EGO03377.1 hypothetical protein SERLA73DRAFT_129674 [Serpula lacrymans var. lacrymans S7.3]EGO29147.1 hypothetical protein SERLADRAFT_377594 [Serpula lacrymans var. lacrymans S7.9]
MTREFMGGCMSLNRRWYLVEPFSELMRFSECAACKGSFIPDNTQSLLKSGYRLPKGMKIEHMIGSLVL